MIISQDPRNILNQITALNVGKPDNAVARSEFIAGLRRPEWERTVAFVSNAAVNTVDAALKRVVILNETVRAFATRLLPLRAFATSFTNVPLAGTAEIVIPYFPLQTAASSNFVEATGYAFDQATTCSMKKITVNKRKYQPLDYSSEEFRRQPMLNVIQLGKLNAEKLGVDVFNDIWSCVTLANFSTAALTVAKQTLSSDDVADLRGACSKANWPEAGRSLILDSDTVSTLLKDESYRAAYSIGGTEAVREGRLPHISGFDIYEIPNLPTNDEKLHGAAVFMSAILAAFSPVEPADGVRAQLAAFEVATDPASGISMNYRKWGSAMLDRNYEVIETAYGYVAGVASALKRIVEP